MRPIRASLAALALLATALPAAAQQEPAAPAPEAPKTSADVLAASKPSDWRALDPANTLYLQLPGGRVVIELAPAFAPKHVANVKQLVRQKYFDGLVVLRSQDNYVVQWGDPAAGDGGDASKKRSLGDAKPALPAEMDRAISDDLPFTKLPDGDVYAPEVGFSLGFPVARDPKTGRTWLAHCYAMVGAGRDVAADSGSGAELYVVIGHAPRHLDRNVTLLGRVVQGMEVLSTLPRGTGTLGFYEDPSEYVPITTIRLGSDLPKSERAHIELLRTDTSTFQDWIDVRRTRREEWFLDPVGKIGLCNVPLPVREPPKPGAGDSGE